MTYGQKRKSRNEKKTTKKTGTHLAVAKLFLTLGWCLDSQWVWDMELCWAMMGWFWVREIRL